MWDVRSSVAAGEIHAGEWGLRHSVQLSILKRRGVVVFCAALWVSVALLLQPFAPASFLPSPRGKNNFFWQIRSLPVMSGLVLLLVRTGLPVYIRLEFDLPHYGDMKSHDQ